MQRTRYTDEQRAEALDLLAELGKAEAARRTGIPAGTIASWGSRRGVAAPPAEMTQAATAARVATMAERKARLAEGLMDDIKRLRDDLFAATVQRKALAVSDGQRQGAHVEVVDIDHDTTTPAERKVTMQAIGIAIGAVQLLIGEATERTEHLVAGSDERRTAALAVVRDLAQRRSA